jgi:PTS system cellobiose-specific IIA component
MTKEKLVEISMMMIMHAGTAKSLLMEAIQNAEKGKYDKIEEYLKKADLEIIEANKKHFEAMELDGKGELVIDVLFLHAEDQFLATQIFVATTKSLIALHRKIDKK